MGNVLKRSPSQQNQELRHEHSSKIAMGTKEQERLVYKPRKEGKRYPGKQETSDQRENEHYHQPSQAPRHAQHGPWYLSGQL